MNELMPINKGEKKKAKEKKTVRCQVDISKDKEKYTEISWYDLLAKQHKNNKDDTNSTEQDKDKPGGGLDPYASDDEDQLKALAAKFEKKYADKPKKKGTKRRINMEDLADGYDRDDPFIDDSECFDEEVPQEITTALGGFYVNSGLLEFKNNSQAVYEISDTDSDDSGKETKSAKIKKEKKPPPVGGIPVLHAKKAKVAKVKHTKARMITTPINSGPKKNKQNSNEIKIIKTKPAQKEIKVLTIIDSPEREEKPQGNSVGKKVEKTTPVNMSNNSSKSSTDKKTTISTMKAKSESSSGKSSSGTSSPIQLSATKAAANSSSGETVGISGSPIIITSGVKATKISGNGGTTSSPVLKVSTSNNITVKSSPVVVNSGKTSVTTVITSKPTTVAKPAVGSSSSSSESSSGDKKDLKAERKVKTVAPVGQVGKSSPKPPEFVDLEAQLNDLANACYKSKTDKVKQNLSNALSLSKSSSPQPSPSSTQADNQKSESTSVKTSVLSSVPQKSTNSTKPVHSSGQQASITKYSPSTSQGTTMYNQVSQSISITRISSSGGTETVNSTSSSQNNSKNTTYSWMLPEKSSTTSASSSGPAVSISPKPSSVLPHSIASLTSPPVHSTAVMSKTSADLNSSRSTQQSTYNQTSPSTIRSVNNQQSFNQSPSSNQKQYSQSQASGGNFSQVSAANQSQAKSQYNSQSKVVDNMVNVSRSGSGNSTYNNSSAGNVNQLMTSSSGYSSKPVAAIPGIRQTTTHSQNTPNQGGVTHQTSPNLTGSKKSQQYGRDAIKQMSSTVGATQHQTHIPNTGVVNPGNINVKNVYNDSYYGAHDKSSGMNIGSSPSHHHIQTSPSNSMHQQVNTSPRMGGTTMSPQGQMTSPRGIVGGMGMMQQGGMANQQANNMYQQQLTQQQQYNQMALNSNIMPQNGVVNQDMRSQFYQGKFNI